MEQLLDKFNTNDPVCELRRKLRTLQFTISSKLKLERKKQLDNWCEFEKTIVEGAERMERGEQHATQPLAELQTRPSRNGSFLPMKFNERQSGVGRSATLADRWLSVDPFQTVTNDSYRDSW